MSATRKIFSLSLLVLLMVTSCTKKIDFSLVDQPQNPETGGDGKEPDPTYYITYKVDGVAVSSKEVTAVRNTTSNPRTLTITGNAGNSTNPKFKFSTKESVIGFVKGLNIGMKWFAYDSDYIEYTNAAGILFSTETEDEGMYLFFSDISYTNGGVASGTFSGRVKNDKGATVQITEGKFNVKFSN